MRRYIRTFVVLLVMTLLVAVAPAASGASHGLKATLDAPGPLLYNDDTDDVDARCPGGWAELGGWIFGSNPDPAAVNTGTMTSDAYTGEFEFVFDHCSRWVSVDFERPGGVQVGKTEAGEMTITTPDGSLMLEYSGTWVLEGAPPFFIADMHLHYKVVDGDGVFDDAKGSGRFFIHLEGGSGTGVLNGSLN